MKWIDFDKQQPEEEQEYLIFMDDGCYWVGMWQPYNSENGAFNVLSLDMGKVAPVRFWQELPKAPSDHIIEYAIKAN